MDVAGRVPLRSPTRGIATDSTARMSVPHLSPFFFLFFFSFFTHSR